MITTPVVDFQTPARILIPKLVRSRDAWKAKATARKKQRKALQIRVRDLIDSRNRHRQRARTLQQELQSTRLQLEHSQQQLQQTQQHDQLQVCLESASLVATPLMADATTIDPVAAKKK
jgi:hypothetical protein